jgi:hypothetical protein
LVEGKDGKGGELQRLVEEKQKTLDAIRVLDQDLRKLTADRGRVWSDCQPQRSKLDPATGMVSVLISTKDPAQPQAAPAESDPTGSEVFIFQDAVYDAQGKLTAPCVYLGEFSVKKIVKNQWDVQPSRGMTEAWLRQQKLARLQDSLNRLQRNEATTWTIYQVLPKENVFEIAAHLPPEAPSPGAKPSEGQLPPAQPQPGPAPQGDQAAANWEKLVERCAGQLCDYEIIFNDYYRQLKDREEAIAHGSQELKTLQEDQAAASALFTLFTERVGTTAAALKVQQAERQETEDLCKRLDAMQQTLRADISETLKTNQALAAEIAKLQLEALRQIRQQTGAVALVPAQ